MTPPAVSSRTTVPTDTGAGGGGLGEGGEGGGGEGGGGEGGGEGGGGEGGGEGGGGEGGGEGGGGEGGGGEGGGGEGGGEGGGGPIGGGTAGGQGEGAQLEPKQRLPAASTRSVAVGSTVRTPGVHADADTVMSATLPLSKTCSAPIGDPPSHASASVHMLAPPAQVTTCSNRDGGASANPTWQSNERMP